MERRSSKSGVSLPMRGLAAARRACRTAVSVACSSRTILKAGDCMAPLPLAPHRARRSAPLQGGRSVQCAASRDFESVPAPLAPMRQIPRKQFALAADCKTVIGALAIGLHRLLTDREV